MSGTIVYELSSVNSLKLKVMYIILITKAVPQPNIFTLTVRIKRRHGSSSFIRTVTSFCCPMKTEREIESTGENVSYETALERRGNNGNYKRGIHSSKARRFLRHRHSCETIKICIADN